MAPVLTPSLAAAAPTPSKDLSTETMAAADFWGAFVPEAQRAAFQEQLAQLLARDFQKHWYHNEPHRGSAFRSIKCDGYGMDKKLLTVLHAVGISRDATTFPPTAVMWVNPGEVKVRFEKAWHSKIIYKDSASAAHPIARKMLQLEIEPTILCSDASDYYSSSSDGDSDSAPDSPMSSPPVSPLMHPASGIATPPTTLSPTLWRSGQDFVPHHQFVQLPPGIPVQVR